MILIAESGSTKTNWLTGNKELHETIGFNPLFFSSENIYDELMKQDGLLKLRDSITEVFFYGASCSSDDRKQIVFDALKKYFTKVNTIKVDHDMNAAAFATCGGKPGIACILGTGSNSCVFDGKRVLEDGPTLGLGYILGDEGSGSYFGKKLLSNYLYHRLPEDISNVLKNELGLTKDLIVERVYMTPNANVYLASFMPFITRFAEHPYIQEMMYEGFRHFIDVHVCCYSNYREVKTHFVGSIAQIFEKQLIAACASLDVQIGSIIRKPIDGLVSYHENHLKLQKS